jgi:hypothetical protein
MPRFIIVAFIVVVAIKAVISLDKHTVYPEYADAGRDIWTDEPLGFVARQYLPFFSLAMTPLAALPDRLACPLWAILNLVVYFTGLRAFHRNFLPHRSGAPVLAVGMLVGLSSLWNQQANALILGCLLWGTAALHRGRWWLAAGCLAIPAFKIYPLALGLVFAVFSPRWGWRWAIVVAALVLVPFLLLGPGTAWTRYIWIAEYAAEGVHSLRFNLVGVREWLMRHHYEMDMRSFFFVQAFTGALIPLVLLLNPDAVLRRGFVLVSLWFVTFGPSVEAPTYLLAAPALAMLLVEARQRDAWIAFGFVLGTILLCGPAQTSLLGSEVQRWLAQNKPACVVLTAAWVWQLADAFLQGWAAFKGREHAIVRTISP